MKEPIKDDQQTSLEFPATPPAMPSDPAKESVEKLFEEEFVPQWERDRRLAEHQALQEGQHLSIRKAWDKAAAMSRARISEKYPSRRRVREWDS